MDDWKKNLYPETSQLVDVDAVGKEYRRRIAKEISDGSPEHFAKRAAGKEMLKLLLKRGVANCEGVYMLYHLAKKDD